MSNRLLDILSNAELVQAVLARLPSIEQIEAELQCMGDARRVLVSDALAR